MRTMYTIEMDADAYFQVREAMLAGAFASRQEHFTAVAAANKAYDRIADAQDDKSKALTRGAEAIMMAKVVPLTAQFTAAIVCDDPVLQQEKEVLVVARRLKTDQDVIVASFCYFDPEGEIDKAEAKHLAELLADAINRHAAREERG